MVAFGYSRVSTSSEHQRSSIRNQRAILMEAGVPDGNIYVDDGRSGKDIEGRPQFQACVSACLEAAKHGVVDLFVTDGSRLGRNIVEDIAAIDELEQAGVKITDLLTNRPISLDDENLIPTVLERALSTLQRRKVQRKIKRVITRKKAEGKRHPRPQHWGYRLDKVSGKLEIVADELPYCGEIVERFIAGATIKSIAEWLTQDGELERMQLLKMSERSKKKPVKRVYENRVRRWLKSPTTRGHTTYGTEIRHNTHQAIITPNQWLEIQAILQKNKENFGRDQSRKVPLSASYIRCAACGGKTRGYNTQYQRKHRCAPWNKCEVSAGTRNEDILQAINQKLRSQAELLAKSTLSPIEDKELAAQIQSIEREKETLEMVIASASIPEVYQPGLDALENRLAELRKQANQAQPADSEEYRELLMDFKDPSFWEYDENDAEDVAELWGIYKSLVKRVSINDGKVVEVLTLWG
ncbi:MAG: recombinase family protein [Cyanobacteria bacterium P01_F01_bin.53]